MNRKQLFVMWVGIAIIVAMCLFPPWRYRYFDDTTHDITYIAGPHRLLFLGPPAVPENRIYEVIEYVGNSRIPDLYFEQHPVPKWRGIIDLQRMFIYGIIFLSVFGGLMITFRSRITPSAK